VSEIINHRANIMFIDTFWICSGQVLGVKEDHIFMTAERMDVLVMYSFSTLLQLYNLVVASSSYRCLTCSILLFASSLFPPHNTSKNTTVHEFDSTDN
jgi:hypothetical protein